MVAKTKPRRASIPDGVILDPEIQGPAVKLYGFIALRTAPGKPGVNISQGEMAAVLGISSRVAVRKYLSQLTGLGWLEMSENYGEDGSQLQNTYTLKARA